jgi:hypothetical protein
MLITFEIVIVNWYLVMLDNLAIPLFQENLTITLSSFPLSCYYASGCFSDSFDFFLNFIFD